MNQSSFENSRRQSWESFAKALTVFQSMKRQRLTETTERDKFLRQFDDISRDLAVAKSRGYSMALVAKLNDLVTEGHYVIHTNQSNRISTIRAFFTVDFAREVRAARNFVLVAAVAFCFPALVTALIVHESPNYIYSVMSPASVNQMEQMYDRSEERIGRERSSSSDIAMFGFYIWNNVSIGFRTFASGILFCVTALAILGYNGMQISAVINHLIIVGNGSTILSFVAGHSAFELTAIVLSGAAGLMLGYALIHPGDVSRRLALRRAGMKAIKIVSGATMLFILAAFIEAFWSSVQAIPSVVKYVVGTALWLLTLSYFLFAGRNADRASPFNTTS